MITQDALTIKNEIDHLIANERPDLFKYHVWAFDGFKIVLRKCEYGWLRLQKWPKGMGPTATISVGEWSQHRWIETGQTGAIESWLNENGVPSEIPFEGEPVSYADEYGLQAVA